LNTYKLLFLYYPGATICDAANSVTRYVRLSFLPLVW